MECLQKINTDKTRILLSPLTPFIFILGGSTEGHLHLGQEQEGHLHLGLLQEENQLGRQQQILYIGQRQPELHIGQ